MYTCLYVDFQVATSIGVLSNLVDYILHASTQEIHHGEDISDACMFPLCVLHCPISCL